MTVLENALNKQEHNKAGAIYNPTMHEPLVVYNKQFYSYAEFNSMFPVDSIGVAPNSLKGENSDGTKRWMKS